MKKNTEENAIDKVASIGTNQASSEIRSRGLTLTRLIFPIGKRGFPQCRASE